MLVWLLISLLPLVKMYCECSRRCWKHQRIAKWCLGLDCHMPHTQKVQLSEMRHSCPPKIAQCSHWWTLQVWGIIVMNWALLYLPLIWALQSSAWREHLDSIDDMIDWNSEGWTALCKGLSKLYRLHVEVQKQLLFDWSFHKWANSNEIYNAYADYFFSPLHWKKLESNTVTRVLFTNPSIMKLSRQFENARIWTYDGTQPSCDTHNQSISGWVTPEWDFNLSTTLTQHSDLSKATSKKYR